MARAFEVGKSYRWSDSGYDPITVVKRTDKTIKVTNGNHEWRMKIRHAIGGIEYVIDSSVPDKWRSVFKCRADWDDV